MCRSANRRETCAVFSALLQNVSKASLCILNKGNLLAGKKYSRPGGDKELGLTENAQKWDKDLNKSHVAESDRQAHDTLASTGSR